eukprot:SAG11_NODE_19495_length_465_cov_1.407104_1_plen_29_part_01
MRKPEMNVEGVCCIIMVLVISSANYQCGV